YLTTGTSFWKLSVPFRISKTAIASIVLEVCTAIWKNMHNKHMKFPSAYGKDSDGGVLSNSSFYQKLENGDIQLPPAEPLPNSNITTHSH
ncbi:Uncharacterized protein OBRU01_16378, partial [Operophtera brumata]